MNSVSKHTPGPWTYNRNTVSNEWRIIPTADGYASVGACWAEANARLIAAAPDMLAALVEMRDHFMTGDECRELAAAIIARAKGG